jgi:hypothetical protein
MRSIIWRHRPPSTSLSSMNSRFPSCQGLTLVHFSAQPKPFWSHLPVYPCLIDWGEIMHPTYPTTQRIQQNVLT